MPLDDEAITQQLALLTAHRRTLAHLLQQAAQFGGEVFAPPQTANGIAQARAEIQRMKAALRDGGVQVEDEPSDEAAALAESVSPRRPGGEQTTISTGGDYAGRDIDKRQGGSFIEGNVYGSVIDQQNIFNQPALAPALRPGSAPPLPALVIGREDDLHTLKARLGISRSVAAPLQVLST